MILNYTEKDPVRLKEIENALPKESIIDTIVQPELDKRMRRVLLTALKEEIEVYKAYPKKMEEEPAKAVKTFDTRNNETCFMGKGFRGNNHIKDGELVAYRKAVGTINHPEWGDCTLMEIWGGDHFEKYPSMVTGVFKYCTGLRKTMPPVRIMVNPLFANKHTGKSKLSKEQKQYKQDMDELLAKAIVFGVRTPAQARKARNR